MINNKMNKTESQFSNNQKLENALAELFLSYYIGNKLSIKLNNFFGKKFTEFLINKFHDK
jgi:hypothetical protein